MARDGVRLRRAREDRRGPPLAARLRRRRRDPPRRPPRPPPAARRRGDARGARPRRRRPRPLRARPRARGEDPHGADRLRVRRAPVRSRGPRRPPLDVLRDAAGRRPRGVGRRDARAALSDGAGAGRRRGSSGSRRLEQHPVQAPEDADDLRRAAHGDQRPGDVRLGGAARVVADREPLVGQPEHDLGRDDEARDAHRMHLRPGHGRAARLLRAVERLDRMPERRPADLAQPLGELARGPGREVGLARARVVEDLPLRQVARREQRRRLRHRGGQGEVPGRDDADPALAGGGVDLGEVRRGQPGGADDGVHPGLDGHHDVALDGGGVGEVDEHVDAVERLGDRPVHRDAERLAAERLAEGAAGGRPADRGAEREVRCVADRRPERPSRPSRRAREAHRQGPLHPALLLSFAGRIIAARARAGQGVTAGRTETSARGVASNSVNRAIGRRVCGSTTAVGGVSTSTASPPIASGAPNVVAPAARTLPNRCGRRPATGSAPATSLRHSTSARPSFATAASARTASRPAGLSCRRAPRWPWTTGIARVTKCVPSKPVHASSASSRVVTSSRTAGAETSRPVPVWPTVSIVRRGPKPWPGAAVAKLTIAGVAASPSSTRWDFQATSIRPVASIAAWRFDWTPGPSVRTAPQVPRAPRWRAKTSWRSSQTTSSWPSGLTATVTSRAVGPTLIVRTRENVLVPGRLSQISRVRPPRVESATSPRTLPASAVTFWFCVPASVRSVGVPLAPAVVPTRTRLCGSTVPDGPIDVPAAATWSVP